MARVLIVEDEAVLRSSLARGLGRMANVEVFDAMSVGEAVTILDRHRPDMIISDIDLPDRSGLEILGELGSRGLSVPVVFVSAYLKAYRAQIPRHANVEVLEKPVGIDELRALVRARLSQRERRGAPFSAPDYLQLSCMGRHSVVISISRDNDALGAIYVVNGEVWSAIDSRGSGADAFRRLAFMTDAEVSCQTLLEDPPERTLHTAWESLLLDSARVIDEGGAQDQGGDASLLGDDWDLAFDIAGDEAILSVETSEEVDADDGHDEPVGLAEGSIHEHSFDDAWEDGVSALLRKDYRAAVTAFLTAHALRPDDASVRANLDRLAAMGFDTDSQAEPIGEPESVKGDER